MSYVERVATLFRSLPNQWVDGLSIAQVGGAYASRTRISDCRKLGMRIDNKVITKPNGVKQSLYRYVPEDAGASLAAVEAAGSSDRPIERL